MRLDAHLNNDQSTWGGGAVMVMFPDLLAVAAAAAFSSASLWAATRFRRASNLVSGPPLQGAANCSGLKQAVELLVTACMAWVLRPMHQRKRT